MEYQEKAALIAKYKPDLMAEAAEAEWANQFKVHREEAIAAGKAMGEIFDELYDEVIAAGHSHKEYESVARILVSEVRSKTGYDTSVFVWA